MKLKDLGIDLYNANFYQSKKYRFQNENTPAAAFAAAGEACEGFAASDCEKTNLL